MKFEDFQKVYLHWYVTFVLFRSRDWEDTWDALVVELYLIWLEITCIVNSGCPIKNVGTSICETSNGYTHICSISGPFHYLGSFNWWKWQLNQSRLVLISYPIYRFGLSICSYGVTIVSLIGEFQTNESFLWFSHHLLLKILSIWTYSRFTSWNT